MDALRYSNANIIYLTRVYSKFKSDTFFVLPEEWYEDASIQYETKNGLKYIISTFLKKINFM